MLDKFHAAMTPEIIDAIVTANAHIEAPFRRELEMLEAELKADRARPPQVHRTWVVTKLERLDDLLRIDPARARVEISKHLDGDLTCLPRPAPITGERRAEIRGRVKSDTLLNDQEAVRLQVVAGLDLNQRPLGSEPFPNRHCYQGATNNAS